MCCLALSCTVCLAGQDEQRLYGRLDMLIARQADIEAEKMRHIEGMVQILKDATLTDAERYAVNDRLYNEYSTLKYDSAFSYLRQNIALAEKMGDRWRATRSRLSMAHILAVAGLFGEAEKALAAIDTSRLEGDVLVGYYKQLNELYLFKSEFASGNSFNDDYHKNMQDYRRLLIANADRDSYDYVSVLADYRAYQGNIDSAIQMLLEYLPALKPGDRRYSIQTSQLAFFYGCKGDMGRKKQYLLLSAISDQAGCIREENSLRELASMLFDEGDYERAYKYLNVSINNANSYGTRLRNTQASMLMPKILAGYNVMKETQHRRMQTLMVCISVIAVMLVVALIAVYMLLKRYRRSNQTVAYVNGRLEEAVGELRRSNAIMKEGNRIKEEYIGRFMELASVLIDKAESYRKLANRYAKEHDMRALYALIKSSAAFNESTSLFYGNFDSAFLRIYPNFVDKVNELLSDECKITPRGERLTTELRILALIRLGITDNHKIAGILRSSITTVYTYRSKLKARSVVKDDFERCVASIDSWQEADAASVTAVESPG